MTKGFNSAALASFIAQEGFVEGQSVLCVYNKIMSKKQLD